MQLCVQMEIDGPRQVVWERLIADFPPDQRRPGKVDMAAIQAEREANTQTGSPRRRAPLPDMEILEWQEGRAFVLHFSRKPYLRSLTADAWLDDAGDGDAPTLLNLRLEVKLYWLAVIPVRFLYWLFRGRIHRLILQALAGLRYGIETGAAWQGDAASLPLDRIAIVPCR